ncbi:YoaK family protein [Nocardioides campestrisoli]|uniref:YoaK family protein n=1 Tax=Nocardioides campestrisoli TaxID=2736757 RepID=UPI0015E7D9A6|nr:YoaK family protein [Nocardioides campestrisoli]
MSSSEPVASRPDRSPQAAHTWLMLSLTFSTGISDGVAYFGLGGTFTGNMTGNVLLLGIGLAPGTHLAVLSPSLAVAGFTVGAALAGRALRDEVGAWPRRTTWLLAAVAGTLLVLGAVVVTLDPVPRPAQVSATTVAATAMGMQAAVARRVAVKDVNTVVVTSTLTALASQPLSGADHTAGALRRFLAVALLLVGALLGAWTVLARPGLGFVLAGLVVAFVTAAGERRTHRG